MFKKQDDKLLRDMLLIEVVAVGFVVIFVFGWLVFNGFESKRKHQPIIIDSSVTPAQATNTPDPLAVEIPTQVFTAFPTAILTEAATFSIIDANKTLPNDIFDEIAYYGGGLGGEPDCSASDNPVIYIPEEVEWMDLFWIYSCGWLSNEIVTVTVINPSGEIEISEKILNEGYNDSRSMGLTYTYRPSMKSQVGRYQFAFEGANSKIMGSVDVVMPSEPRLYRLTNPVSLILYGLRPKEKIRLLAYSQENGSVGYFLGWNSYVTDENGQFQIIIQSTRYDFYFVAVGEITGVVSEEILGLSLGSRIKKPFDLMPEYVNKIDGAEIITIPSGAFEMGVSLSQYDILKANDAAKEILDSSQLVHTVALKEYRIYKTEVSNAMYALCIEAGNCLPPVQYSSQKRQKYFGNPDFADYPVVYVTWQMAQTYCNWAGGRLPTEAEWEYAARGPDSLLFPWGNDIPVSSFVLANWDNNIADTTPVNGYLYLGGSSPFGLLNMTGNVWEWVQDWYRADYYITNSNWDNPTGPSSGDNSNGELKAGKGGSFWTTIGNSSPALHDWYQADQASAAVGFRCVIAP